MSASVKGRLEREYDRMIEDDVRREIRGLPLTNLGILDFSKSTLGFTPFAYQEKLMLDPAQFIAARWCRQSGKSHTIATMLVHQALSRPGSRMIILAPALRQGKKIIGKINGFIRTLSEQDLEVVEGKPTRSRLEFRNGSTIEALPNNPATIRGETAHTIFVDEMNYIKNDEELLEAIVYSLNTTNGRLIATSTPGSTDSLFYKMCTDDEKFGDVSRHHVTYKEALEPNGPLKLRIVEKLERQNKDDPTRWIREMMADFSEDEDAWFPLSLITRCVTNDLVTFDDSELLTDDFSRSGIFYVGLDLGKKIDHSAVAVLEKTPEGVLRTLHVKRFKLGTEYGIVLGYLRQLNQKLHTVRTIEIDQTGVGDYFVEDAIKTGLKNVHGTMLTLPMKEEIMGLAKKRMEEGKLQIHYDWDLINEFNVERYQLTKAGRVQFSHPNGTHDDRLWAIALAIYAAKPEIPQHRFFATTGRNPNYIGPTIDLRRLRPGANTCVQLPGEPAGLYRAGHVWCLACGKPMLTRPRKCGEPPS